METLQAIAKRKSTRKYLSKQIPEKDLENIAATDLGLGSTYLTGFLPGFCEDESQVKEAGVADEFTPSAGILIGYPETEDDSVKVGIRTNIVHYIR